MNDDEIEALRDELRDQRETIREYLDGQGVDVGGWDGAVPDADPEPAESD